MRESLLALLMLGLTAPAYPDSIKVENAWARATAPGQKVAAGFMDLTADTDMVLLGGSSPVSKSVELHFMRMENGVMEMRQLKEIRLPRGQTVRLQPGDLHVMLIGLKNPIREGQKVPLTLMVKGADGKEKKLAIAAEVRRTSSD
jgi:copper(I)-binding protein